jgi:hypothetical protein
MLTVLTLILQIASCPINYDPQNPVTSGQIASRNPNFNIPYDEQQILLDAVDQLYQNKVEFVIIKVNGGGTNLPGFTLQCAHQQTHMLNMSTGYFTLSLDSIYNVRLVKCDRVECRKTSSV